MNKIGLWVMAAAVTFTGLSSLLADEKSKNIAHCNNQQRGEYYDIFDIRTNIKLSGIAGMVARRWIADLDKSPTRFSIQYERDEESPNTCLNIVSFAVRTPRASERNGHPCEKLSGVRINPKSELTKFFIGNLWSDNLPPGGSWQSPPVDPNIAKYASDMVAMVPSVKNISFDIACGNAGDIAVKQGNKEFRIFLSPVVRNGVKTGEYEAHLRDQSDNYEAFNSAEFKFDEQRNLERANFVMRSDR